MIMLEKLEKDLKSIQAIDPKFNSKKVIFRSEFIESLSNVQFGLLRDYNP
jgi:hypothetical protein